MKDGSASPAQAAAVRQAARVNEAIRAKRGRAMVRSPWLVGQVVAAGKGAANFAGCGSLLGWMNFG
ncbi:hypothetical protein LBMAG53_38090 [Planctomycetota bacterium]|nr:hypothetical protein LBMAG53_38090 [Planctomycetota bacterium]